MSACADVAHGDLTGRVWLDDAPVADVTVASGPQTTQTDSDGRFRLDLPGAAWRGVTAALGPTHGLSDASCRPFVELIGTSTTPFPTARMVIGLRGVPADATFDVRYAHDVGDVREPDVRQVDLGAVPFSQLGSVWSGEATVPAAGPWALAVSVLGPARGRDDLRVATAVLIVGGDALEPNEIHTVDAYVSPETLRAVAYWDASGPKGIDTAWIEQATVRGVPVDVTVYRGPVAEILAVPLVRVLPDDPRPSIRAELRYGPAGPCASRPVGMPGRLSEGQISGQFVDGADPEAMVRVTRLDLPKPWPSPPSLTRTGGPQPTLAWSNVPDAAVDVSFTLTDGDWRWQGDADLRDGGCDDRTFAWPPIDDAPALRLAGQLSWASEDQWGRCVVQEK